MIAVEAELTGQYWLLMRQCLESRSQSAGIHFFRSSECTVCLGGWREGELPSNLENTQGAKVTGAWDDSRGDFVLTLQRYVSLRPLQSLSNFADGVNHNLSEGFSHFRVFWSYYWSKITPKCSSGWVLMTSRGWFTQDWIALFLCLHGVSTDSPKHWTMSQLQPALAALPDPTVPLLPVLLTSNLNASHCICSLTPPDCAVRIGSCFPAFIFHLPAHYPVPQIDDAWPDPCLFWVITCFLPQPFPWHNENFYFNWCALCSLVYAYHSTEQSQTFQYLSVVIVRRRSKCIFLP